MNGHLKNDEIYDSKRDRYDVLITRTTKDENEVKKVCLEQLAIIGIQLTVLLHL